MTPRHRQQTARTGGGVRRAVLTSVLSALGLTTVTITAAAITLTSAEPQPATPAAMPPAATSTAAEASLAAPVEVVDAPLGIPEIALVAADGPSLADIPSPALGAYQRAEAVLAQADERCKLDWTLLAAVGHVVTGHGTTAGSELNDRGVMTPRHAGKPLRGRNGEKLSDSDAGRVDGDERLDRPVGPMQLSPATWAVVGVDSDGDGRRNAHDIDDAALAVAVLLCSGDGDLRRRDGRIDGVGRVNDDRAFIATVLAVDRSYQAQLAVSVDTDPVVVVPTRPPTDLPTDLPTAVADARASRPSEALPQPDDPSSHATDPVTWTPPPGPKPSATPTTTQTVTPAPSDTTTPDPCTTEPVDPTDPTETLTPTDGSTRPTEVPTVTETVSPTEDATDDPTGLPECPATDEGD